MQIWNDLQQTETKQLSPVLMSPNYRPLKPLNGRLLRTNINIRYKVNSYQFTLIIDKTDNECNFIKTKCKHFQANSPQSCPSNLYIDMGYKANPRLSPTVPSSILKRSLTDNTSDIF